MLTTSTPWPSPLLAAARAKALLSRHGDHGFSHWARVRHHGVSLARVYGVNPWIPSLFGLFHDCRRENEYLDPGHGPRAGELVLELASEGLFRPWLSTREVDWLAEACQFHSDGLIHGPAALLVCWDADRLDLGRVGTRPLPELLCTEAARDPFRIEAAYAWSCGTPRRCTTMGNDLATSILRPGAR